MPESATPKKSKTTNKPNRSTLKPDDRYDTFVNAVARASEPIAQPEMPDIDPVTVTIGELETIRNRMDSEKLAAHQVKLAEIEAAIDSSEGALEALDAAATKATKRLEQVSQEIEQGLHDLGMTKDNSCRRHTPSRTKDILWQRRIEESPRWVEVNNELKTCKTQRGYVRETMDRLERQKGDVRRGVDKIVGSYLKDLFAENAPKRDLFIQPGFRND